MVNAKQDDDAYRRELSQMFKKIRCLAVCNREYFKGASGIPNECFYAAFSQLLEHLDGGVVRGIRVLLGVAPQFDYDPRTPGNGYRSMIAVVHKCCLRIMNLSRYVVVNRESYLFRAVHYSKELEAFVTTLGQLRACLHYLQKLVPYCNNGELFPDEDTLVTEQYQMAERLMLEVECLNQESFYGRCLAFQFCDSMVRPLTGINLLMASYSEGYSRTSSSVMRLATSVLGCGKYIMNPELRAQQVVNMTRNCDIHFCKAFWSLGENYAIHNVPLYACPAVAVNKVLIIDAVPFEIPLVNGSRLMTIKPPSAHSGVGPVTARLISAEYRSGQEVWYSRRGLRLPSFKAPLEKSPYLIVHCHGGGFISQSSASHQVYLNQWASELGIPILSIDYSLAPEQPFPRQHEELFFAYCWAVKNCNLLGSTGAKICMVGDSAGANMAVSVAMRLASYGLRPPDGVMSIYGCLLVRYTPSPSRMLSLMDPLLPLGVIALCLRAYTGETEDDGDSGEFGNLSAIMKEMAEELPNNDCTCQNVCGKRQNVEEDVVVSLRRADETKLIKNKPKIENFSPERLTKRRIELSRQDELLGYRQNSPLSDLKHRREDSGFFDVSEQLDPNVVDATTLLCDGKNVDGKSDSDESSNDAAFVVKESSDEECESVSLSCDDEQSTDENVGTSRLRVSSPLSSHDPNSTFEFSDSVSASSKHLSLSTQNVDDNFRLVSKYAQIRHFAQSPMENSRHLKTAKHPYVSPIMASDELLKKICPVYLLACHLDPLLDDSIMFARRLRSLGRPVQLELIPDVPHGFLNFVLISQEAKSGSSRCVHNIRKMFKLNV